MGIVFSKSSNVNNSFFGKSQEPIKMLLDREVDAFKEMSAIPKLFKEVKSNNFAEKFVSRTALSAFENTEEGGDYPEGSMQEGYSKVVEPYTWKLSFAITREMVEDNKLIDMQGNALGFIDAYNRTRERYAGAMLAGGVGTSIVFDGVTYNTACADGKALFAKDHPSITSGTAAQSNLFADAFSEDALGAAECAMQGFKDDNGNVLNVAPDTIVIPNNYAIKKAVFEVIGADKDPNTANNGFNYQFGRWNVIVWPYLAAVSGGAAPWLLVDSKYNKSRGTAVWVDRKPLEVASYIEDKNDNNVWKGYSRFGIGFNNWRGMAIGGVTGGTALIG